MNDAFDEFLNDKKERRAITITLLFLGGGFLALWFLKNVLAIEGDSVAIAMLLLPLIVYLIVSGRISELKTPGGLEAKFTAAASESVTPASETVEPEDVQVPVEGQMALQSVIPVKKPDDSRPIVMTVTLGQGENHYSRGGLLNAVEVYSQYRNFKFVVFLDQENRFQACMPSWAIKNLLGKEALGNEFVTLVNSGNIIQLADYPGMIMDTITTQTSNIDALKEMTGQNIEAMIVISEKKALAGVVEREQILSKILLALTQ